MKEKALIIIPHQDDEVNLVGNIMDEIIKQFDITVLYCSIDTDPKLACIRKQEAIDSCNVWGISKEQLLFLDYPDTPNSKGEHWFSDRYSEVIGTLKNYILSIKPFIIFATDFDFHSDHRMVSLSFEKAMGQIIREELNYRPIVLKGFCYETSYYSVNDYRASNIGCSVSTLNPLSNPSFEWDNRISIKSNEKANFIWKRKAYIALVKHKSQYAVLHASSVVNADNVFWLRRTDNLLTKATINSSKSDIEKIRDFLILDTEDLITIDPRKIDYSKAVCKFNKNDWLKAKWDNPVFISRIIFHSSINQLIDKKIKVKIELDNNVIEKDVVLKSYGRKSEITVSFGCVSKLIIQFKSDDTDISEIEVFNGNIDIPFTLTDNVGYSNKSNSKICDFINIVIYHVIVLRTKFKRKIKNLILGKGHGYNG